MEKLEDLNQEEKLIYILDYLSDEELNVLILNKIQHIERDSLLKIIEIKGKYLEKESISFLIDLKEEDIILGIANNHDIDIDVCQMRDMIHLVPENELKVHPSYKNFWIETYIKEESDFLQHTKNHIKNVNIIANHLVDYILQRDDLKKYFGLSKSLDNETIRNVIEKGIKLHDQAKICENEDFLKENDLKEPLYKTLYSFYGKGMNPNLKKVVDKLNLIDEKIIKDFLSEKEESLQSFFLKIEKMADCIERGCNKITPEEMSQRKIKPSKYLEGALPNTEIEIIKHFENVYYDICTSTL